MKKSILAALVAFGLSIGATSAIAEEDKPKIIDYDFSFEGPFGKFDKDQLQRGLQVYTEVCAACHGLKQVAFRNLGDEGGPSYSAEEVKAYAKTWDIYNAEADEDLPGKPSDKFPENTAAGAPDLSVMAKARTGFHGPYGLLINQLTKGLGGTEYIASLLTGYTGEEKEEAGSVLYGNTAFTGGFIAMPTPLEDGQVEYADGTRNDVRQMAMDVSAFLMWTAEPKLMARKRFGFVAFIFLSILGVLLYLTNKKIWAPIKRKET